MSLEATIQENTSAIRELIAALSHGKESTLITKKTQKTKPADLETKVQDPVTPDTIAYTVIAEKAVALATSKGRDAATKILAKFATTEGSTPKNFREVQECDYAEVLKSLEEAIA